MYSSASASGSSRARRINCASVAATHPDIHRRALVVSRFNRVARPRRSGAGRARALCGRLREPAAAAGRDPLLPRRRRRHLRDGPGPRRSSPPPDESSGSPARSELVARREQDRVSGLAARDQRRRRDLGHGRRRIERPEPHSKPGQRLVAGLVPRRQADRLRVGTKRAAFALDDARRRKSAHTADRRHRRVPCLVAGRSVDCLRPRPAAERHLAGPAGWVGRPRPHAQPRSRMAARVVAERRPNRVRAWLRGPHCDLGDERRRKRPATVDPRAKRHGPGLGPRRQALGVQPRRHPPDDGRGRRPRREPGGRGRAAELGRPNRRGAWRSEPPRPAGCRSGGMKRLLLVFSSAAGVIPAAYGAFKPRLPAPGVQRGPRIAFDDGSHDVWAVRADGSQRRRLTSDPAPEFDPTWPPDGSKLAYRSEVDENAEIYVMNADGSGKRNLTRNPAEDYSPAWSPGGKRIAFASSRSGVLNDIYVMNADGSHVRRVTRHVSADEYPTWSPNGKRLAFASDRTGHWEIFAIDLDGRHERRITRAGGKAPAWSRT